jgi:hypothetical protein
MARQVRRRSKSSFRLCLPASGFAGQLRRDKTAGQDGRRRTGVSNVVGKVGDGWGSFARGTARGAGSTRSHQRSSSKSEARPSVRGLRRRPPSRSASARQGAHWGRAGADVAAQRPYLGAARAPLFAALAPISLRENSGNPTPIGRKSGTRLFAQIFFRAVPVPFGGRTRIARIAPAANAWEGLGRLARPCDASRSRRERVLPKSKTGTRWPHLLRSTIPFRKHVWTKGRNGVKKYLHGQACDMDCGR